MPDSSGKFRGSGWSRAREDGWERAFRGRWGLFTDAELDEIFDGLTRDPASGRSCAVMEEYSPIQFGLVAGVVGEIGARGRDARPYETALIPLGEE